MRTISRTKEIVFGIIKRSAGTPGLKRAVWNKEFAGGCWDSLGNTRNDIVYHYIQEHCRKGSILDLGCGSGNTGCELDPGTYHDYTGVDISDVAVEMAARRSNADRRGGKNRYHQSDMTTYTPTQKYDVILFRESLPYIPRPRIKAVLNKYSQHLKRGGVFIITWWDKKEAETILDVIGQGYEQVEASVSSAGRVIAVLRPNMPVPG